jgi:hypothetical protein
LETTNEMPQAGSGPMNRCSGPEYNIIFCIKLRERLKGGGGRKQGNKRDIPNTFLWKPHGKGHFEAQRIEGMISLLQKGNSLL